MTGQVRWQDRLNNYNLPFFPSSTAFFTNYTARTITFIEYRDVTH